MRFERELFLQSDADAGVARAAPCVLRRARRRQDPDVPEDTPTRAIRSVAVIGAGTMGGGIAMNFLNAGIPVTMLEMKQEALDNGRGDDPQELRERRSRRASSRTDRSSSAWRSCSRTLDYDDIRRRRPRASRRCSRTWTSRSRCSRARRSHEAGRDPRVQHLDARHRPDRRRSRSGRQDVSALHFFSPANVMQLLEVVRGAETAQRRARHAACSSRKKIKKTAVVSGVCDGFIGNRMIEQYVRQARLPARRRARRRSRSTGRSRNSAWRWARSAWATWPATTSAGPSASARYVEKPACRVLADRRPAVRGWAASARRPAPAGIATSPASRDAHPRSRCRRDHRRISRRQSASRRARSPTTRSSSAASTRWSTRARASSRKASRARRPTSTWSTSTGYGFPRYRGGPMFYADTVGLVERRALDAALRGEPARPTRILAARAAAAKLASRRQDVQS